MRQLFTQGGSQMLKHKIKKEEGSGLVLTLMVLLVLSVLGASVATVTMGSNRLGHATQDSNSAYYIAEAGANMAYEEIRQGVVNAYDSNNELGVQTTIDSLPDKYNNFDIQSGHQPEAHVSVSDPETEGSKKTYRITSTGKIGPSSRTVIKEFVVNWKKTPTGGGISDSNFPLGAAIIAKSKIDFRSGTITGDIYLDSSKPNTFVFGDNLGNITAEKISTQYTGDKEDIFVLENWMYNDDNFKKDILNKTSFNNKDKISWEEYSKVSESIIIPNYDAFPTFKDELITNDQGNQYQVIRNNSIYIDNYVSDEYTLVVEKNYFVDTIRMAENRTLEIQANNKDVNLVVRNLDIAQGDIKILGDGKVNFYVLESLNITGSINENSDTDKFNLYYYGNSKMELSDASSVSGGIFIDHANLKLTGSGNITGPIVSNGLKVEIDGGSKNEIFVMAPRAKTIFTGGGTVKGIVVSEEIELNGGATIQYAPYDFSNFPFGFSPGNGGITPDIDDLINSGPAIEK